LLAHLTHRQYIFGYDTFRADAPMAKPAQNPDFLISDDLRLQENEKLALDAFIANGYRSVFKFAFMEIFARPDFPQETLEKLTAGWRHQTEYPEVSYRKYARRWYTKLFVVGLVLFGILLIVRSFRRL
jgi:hypothetical protein